MREENRSEIIHEALNLLDDEMIEEVDRLRGGVVDVVPSAQKIDSDTTQESSIQREFRPWRKWVALAASVCVLIIVGTLWNGSMSKGIFNQADDMNLNQEENKQEGIDLELNSGTEIMSGEETKDKTEYPGAEYCWAASVYGGENYKVGKSKVDVMDVSLRLFENNLKMELGKDEKNILISPTSVLYALGMTSFGARGETLSQMEKVFGTSRGELNRYLSEEINNNSNELKVANSIWFTDDEGFTIKPEFFQFNKDFFQVDIFESSFDEETVKDINAWVESKTDGSIKEVLDIIPENTVMYLVNAMLFEAEWADKYTELQIHDGIFTTYDGIEQQVEMMHGVERLYLEDENASGFMKYYKNKKYAFVALLPKENISVYEYAKSLTGEHLEEMLSNPKEVKVYSQIPQFSCDYSVDMQQILKSMGMVDLFDVYKANLEGIGVYAGRNIYVGRVIHKTFIEVTPVGTKAGAATLVELPTYGAAPEPEEVKEVHLDRPFIYMIIDCENNQPVFIGAVNSIE